MAITASHFVLSQNRLEHIEKAKTLDDAQRLSLLDKIKDWWRGGVKAEAIKQAFEQLHSPDHQAKHEEHGNMLLHFNNVRTALRAEHANKCKLNVQVNQDNHTWSYQMVLDGKTLVAAKDLPIKSGYTLAAFQDYAMLAELGNYLNEAHGADCADQVQTLHEQFCEINARQADSPSQDATSLLLEKFRIISNNLEALGAPSKGCFPSLQLSTDLSEAELAIGKHAIGTYAIATQAILTDTLTTMAQVATTSVNHFLKDRDVDEAIVKTMQDMVDDPKLREATESLRHDPFFSRQNFVGIQTLTSDTPDGMHPTFTATFRDATTGREESLTLSNRAATNNEFRGLTLQNSLALGAYSTLAELISQRLGTKQDSEITYFMTVARFGLMEAMSILESDDETQSLLGFSDAAEAKTYFQNLKESVLAPMKIGNTDLDDIWNLKTTQHGSLRQREPNDDGAQATETLDALDTAQQPLPVETLSPDIGFLIENRA